MGLFSRLFGRRERFEDGDIPWHDRPSIYKHIKSNLDGQGKLTRETYDLPDEERRSRNARMWAPGAIDGAYAHHAGSGNLLKEAERVASLVKLISILIALSSKVELYNILVKDSLVEFLDPALAKIIEKKVRIFPYLCQYASWLAFKSPDRGPVKFGIALLGLVGDSDDIEKISMLARHEEFTLYSIVAIMNIKGDSERELFDLAKYVDGWGKIHIVERLAKTEDPEIKRWLLREGYKNSVMYEYLAYTCAKAGDLKAELSKPEIDDELLDAASDIIEALSPGGPAEDIDDYADAPEVVRLYVNQMKDRVKTLKQFTVLHFIKRYLEDDDPEKWKKRTEKGWTEELRNDLLADLHGILDDPRWKDMVFERQHTEDDAEFWRVNKAAGILGIDLWETHWRRVSDRPTEPARWFDVTMNANDERIDQIIALAMEKIPLDKIATGPKDEMGLSSEFQPHSCLGFVIQGLYGYPGKGFELVKAGLESPVNSNRSMAISALSAWRAGNWPEGTIELLIKAREREPKEFLKKSIGRLLSEKPPTP